MKKLSIFFLSLLCFIAANAQQGGLPVWPLVTGHLQTGTTQDLTTKTPHQALDWSGSPAQAVDVTTAAEGSNRTAPSQAGFDGCNQMVFYALHNGTFSPNTNSNLHLFSFDGTRLHLDDGEMMVNAGDNEVQIIRRPGQPNQWFIVYSIAPSSIASGHPGYTVSNLGYSLIQISGQVADYVNDVAGNPIKDKVLSVGGNAFKYMNGKATSRTSTEVGMFHDIYVQRRSSGSDTDFEVDKFSVGSGTDISYTASTPTISSHAWNLGIAGSPIELSPDESKMAVTYRTQYDNRYEIYVFDVTSSSALANTPDIFKINELYVEFNSTAPGSSDQYQQAQYFQSNSGTGFDYLRNLERKISDIEFSFNGDYLYFVGGGWSNGGYSYATYLAQIDLTSDVRGTGHHSVRLQTQQSGGTFNATTGLGSYYRGSSYPFYVAWKGLSYIESSINGNLYFTKRNDPYLNVLPNPNDPMPINMTPHEVDFSTASNPNIITNGDVWILPDQIDGFDYSIQTHTAVTFNVSNQFICNCDSLTLDVLDTQDSALFARYYLTECPTEITLCLKNGSSYNLVGDNGVSFNNAISSNGVNYPAGAQVFQFGAGGTLTAEFSNDTTCKGDSIHFTSAYAEGSHYWEFGNGINSTEANPTVVFDSEGTFSITHVVIHENCIDSIVDSISIEDCGCQEQYIVCPEDIKVAMPSGGGNCGKKGCKMTIDDIGSPQAIGPCENVVTISNDAPENNEYPVGVTVVNWIIVDDNGVTYTCVQNIEVTLGYDTEVISVVENNGCYDVELKVTCNNASCGLSNYIIEVPCGNVDMTSVSNSLGFPMSFVYDDKNTGLTGVKVDNISDFCENGDQSEMIITYTVCVSEGLCNPKVSYKAGTCVQYQTLDYSSSVENPWVNVYNGNQIEYELNIAPNPFHGESRIIIKGDYTQATQLQVMNLLGEIVKSYPVQDQASFLINGDEIGDGIFIMMLINDHEVLAKEKVVIVK